ncbi:putative transposase element L1Md-A101/L1Md-A102/L1Md-A2 [Labeo rohita]|uniref:Putative transposase element L1Md-A101/L1Md-A102/L1Md-A2 n=1 Tax=Labeo rohita TaxID=84645 RepID=A0A498NNJ6_LABRO|nr:putative transposase element L1Md-A101/L1Md-A102/L1Md-A2 [Labeo rohita]
MAAKNIKTRSTIQTQLRPSLQTATTPSSEPLSPVKTPSSQANPDIDALKVELLALLRKDIADIFKKVLQDTLGDALSTIKFDLQAVKTQLAIDKAANDATVSELKGTVKEMEHTLTVCSDDLAEMKNSIMRLMANVAKLENKCEDLESRTRRNNVRIVGVPEGPNTSTTAAVASLLKEAFNLEKESLLDRSHRTLQPTPKPGDRPRAIVCRFHYHTDCVDILRRARERRQIKVGDQPIAVFPDYTAKIARARTAFNVVRQQLRGIEGVRYGLFHPARLRITYKGVEKDFVSAEEAGDYVKTLISG